jgi:hypothetical protein
VGRNCDVEYIKHLWIGVNGGKLVTSGKLVVTIYKII